MYRINKVGNIIRRPELLQNTKLEFRKIVRVFHWLKSFCPSFFLFLSKRGVLNMANRKSGWKKKVCDI